ncbi:unnamed protein product [Urochloa decumbens]|uniref:Uncharacterized protein n=1 Tax=Urochloa decumbens TaxID=240449 RepID=A0ABC9EBH6_9POAL
MEGANEDDAGLRPAAAVGRGNNDAPPPPPSPDDEANGGGHRRAQRRPRRRRLRVRALGAMMAAGAYILLAEALAGARPEAAWMFTAFVLWNVGKWLLLLSFMN